MPKCERVEACRNEEEEREKGGNLPKKTCGGGQSCFCGSVPKKSGEYLPRFGRSCIAACGQKGSILAASRPPTRRRKISSCCQGREKKTGGGGKKYGSIFEGVKGGNSRFGCFSFLFSDREMLQRVWTYSA